MDDADETTEARAQPRRASHNDASDETTPTARELEASDTPDDAEEAEDELQDSGSAIPQHRHVKNQDGASREEDIPDGTIARRETPTVGDAWGNQVARLVASNPDTMASIARIQEMLASPAIRAGVAAQRHMVQGLVDAMGPIARELSYTNQRLIQSLQPLFRNSLSLSTDFTGPTQKAAAYSPELTTPGAYFERHEVVVDSFDELNTSIALLTQKNPRLRLVWRGQQRAEWGMHNGLYRALMSRNGVIAPEMTPDDAQPYPEEDEVREAEKRILDIARSRWRFDNISALELFARIQHHGAPTRLIDVTRNPYIAAWFAVEQSDAHDQHDARLFAISTAPLLQLDEPSPDTTVRLDETGATREPFWHHLTSTDLRQAADWGTGAQRRIWVPPAYDERIVAQNAAFLLDGVPITVSKVMKYFPMGEGSRSWNKSDLLAASSIYAKTVSADSSARYNKHHLAPTFSFRLTAEGKKDIRQTLEQRFLYDASTLYPDISGLAGYIRGAMSA
jgi:hypothetical protein